MTVDPAREIVPTTEGEPPVVADPAGVVADPAADPGESGISIDDLKAKSAAEKQRYEQRIQELEEERRRLQETPRPLPAGDDVQKQQRLLEESKRQLDELAQVKIDPDTGREIKPDPLVVVYLHDQMENAKEKQISILERQLLRAPKELQQEILDSYVKGGYRDIDHARENIERKKLETENATLRAQVAGAGKKPEGKPVPTSAREGPSVTTSSKPEISSQEFDARVAQVRAEKGHIAAMKEQERLLDTHEVR